MKATGIVRRLDELGRIVLPIELRRTMDLGEKDPLEIFIDGDSIVLRRYQPNCIFCGDSKRLIEYKGKVVCRKCAQAIVENKE